MLPTNNFKMIFGFGVVNDTEKNGNYIQKNRPYPHGYSL